MNHAQHCKYLIVTSPAAIVDNNSYTTNSIDTNGFGYLQVIVMVGALDIAMTALKLQTSDTDGSYADLTGAVFGTSENIDGATSALPTATDDNKIFVLEVDLRGKKRYFDLVATMGDGSTGGFVSAVAILSKASIAPTLAAGRGADEVVRVG
jgi:hypothetical protein